MLLFRSENFDADFEAKNMPYMGVPFTTKDSIQAKGL